ncbi:hypothetical protein [Kitasatospora mediocidica]|uniref:hypothetical protein n=1 Tax=Kitasatospora mediocidica TaxID=58352 RepID=UPI00055F08A3|nr:hypothetical protein [Kitasatospora mediocidica]
MSGSYYVSANEAQGARWAFTADDLARVAVELRPDAMVSAPSGSHGTVEILLPGERRDHSVLYHSGKPVLVFREQDDLEAPAAMVLQLLQRLAPDVATVWFADFEGVVHALDVACSVDDFIDELTSD